MDDWDKFKLLVTTDLAFRVSFVCCLASLATALGLALGIPHIPGELDENNRRKETPAAAVMAVSILLFLMFSLRMAYGWNKLRLQLLNAAEPVVPTVEYNSASNSVSVGVPEPPSESSGERSGTASTALEQASSACTTRRNPDSPGSQSNSDDGLESSSLDDDDEEYLIRANRSKRLPYRARKGYRKMQMRKVSKICRRSEARQSRHNGS